MLIVLAIYAAFIWLVFFKLELLPWGRGSKTVVSIVGLVIVLVVIGLLNSQTPSGRVTVLAPVVEVAPVVSGTVAEIPVTTNTMVSKGDVLLRLDKRPFEYARDLAEANFAIAEKTYERRSTAYEVNQATVSKQAVDESLAALKAAEAQLRIAEYNLDHTDLLSPAKGEVTAIRVNVGDQVPAMSGVMPLIRSDDLGLAGVFKQNGNAAVQPGSVVGLVLDTEPGTILWTTIEGRTKGTSSGQVRADATLLGAADIGSSSELLILINWPDSLDPGTIDPGTVGSATVFAPDAGPIAALAKVLLWVKSLTAYL